MKNILIPTTLERDTIQAVNVALSQATQEPQTIILMLLRDTPESASASLWLRKMQHELTPQQELLLEECRERIATHPNCKLKLQKQFSLTGPLLRNFNEAWQIGLVIVTEAFAQSPDYANRHFLNLIAKGKTPFLRLSSEWSAHELSRALYLEKTPSQVPVSDLQQLIGGHFSFRIISQAKVFELQDYEEMTPVLHETINKNSIDLLIETRRPKKIRLLKNSPSALSESLGLPVLSIAEPTY